MALLDFEGFDRETNLALSNWWNFGVGSGAVSADGTGPFGYGRAINVPYGNGRTFAPQNVLWVNFHVYLTGAPGGDRILSLLDSASEQVMLTFTSDLRINVRAAGTNYYSTLPVLAFNAWYFVQIRVRIDNSVGTVDVYINGSLKFSMTGDTQSTANNSVNQWAMFNPAAGSFYDNFIIYNETGAAPNAKTPETRIFATLPTGAGAASGFTPSAGANWQNVDEQPNDGDTTYNSAAAAVTDDLYVCGGSVVPAGSIVYALAVEIDARKDDAGLNDIDGLIRSGGTTYANGDTFGLTSTWQRFRSVATLDPATGAAWTVANINNAEVGVRRKT